MAKIIFRSHSDLFFKNIEEMSLSTLHCQFCRFYHGLLVIRQLGLNISHSGYFGSLIQMGRKVKGMRQIQTKALAKQQLIPTGKELSTIKQLPFCT